MTEINQQTIFYLARHGQTIWNTEHRLQGQVDTPLTQKGIAQASKLANQASHCNITHILSSSLGRGKETARLCNLTLKVKTSVLAGIEERNFGLWQGKLMSELQSEHNFTEIFSQVTDCRPPAGESAKQLLTRFETALKQQLTKGKDESYLFITHGDLLRCFMSRFAEDNSEQNGYDYPNGYLISLRYDHQGDLFFIQ